MSDAFYTSVRFVGRSAFWVSSSPIVMGVEHVPARGPVILASTHESPYDVPLLIRHTPRLIDFVSIVEVFRNPIVGFIYGSLNAFPLDRSRADSKTVRVILDRLRAGRAVGMFPEGGLRRGKDSVVRGGRIRSGIGRIAALTGAPIVPCVVINSGSYARFASWLPLRHTRYGLAYGAPIAPGEDPAATEAALVARFIELHQELESRMSRSPTTDRGRRPDEQGHQHEQRAEHGSRGPDRGDHSQ